MEEADLCIRIHRLGRTRLANRAVTTSVAGSPPGVRDGQLDLPQDRSTLGLPWMGATRLHYLHGSAAGQRTGSDDYSLFPKYFLFSSSHHTLRVAETRARLILARNGLPFGSAIA